MVLAPGCPSTPPDFPDAKCSLMPPVVPVAERSPPVVPEHALLLAPVVATYEHLSPSVPEGSPPPGFSAEGGIGAWLYKRSYKQTSSNRKPTSSIKLFNSLRLVGGGWPILHCLHFLLRSPNAFSPSHSVPQNLQFLPHEAVLFRVELQASCRYPLKNSPQGP